MYSVRVRWSQKANGTSAGGCISIRVCGRERSRLDEHLCHAGPVVLHSLLAGLISKEDFAKMKQDVRSLMSVLCDYTPCSRHEPPRPLNRPVGESDSCPFPFSDRHLQTPLFFSIPKCVPLLPNLAVCPPIDHD